jgi:hypothetical protein
MNHQQTRVMKKNLLALVNVARKLVIGGLIIPIAVPRNAWVLVGIGASGQLSKVITAKPGIKPAR